MLANLVANAVSFWLLVIGVALLSCNSASMEHSINSIEVSIQPPSQDMLLAAGQVQVEATVQSTVALPSVRAQVGPEGVDLTVPYMQKLS